MTATLPRVEDWTLVDQVYTDPAILPTMHKKAILLAVLACAAEHDREIHASTMREYLPPGVNPSLVGNVMSQLANKGITERTGESRPSGQCASRNRTKDLAVRRVTSMARLALEVAA